VSRSYSTARRRGLLRRIARRLTGRPTELLALEEVRERLQPLPQSYAGLRTIAIDRIVGSVDRSVDFDRDFGPLSARSSERWQRLAEVFPEGDFPPIDVYELGGGYFVEDGHHRVALARHQGAEFIDALVTKVYSPVELVEDIDVGDLIHLEQERAFLTRSGLAQSRPTASVRFSRPQGYAQLLDLVQAFAYAASMREQRLLEPAIAAARWWDERYLPSVDEIRRQGMHEAFPYRTDGDLFLVVHAQRQNLAPGHAAISLAEAVAAARNAGHSAGPLERRQRIRTKRRRARTLRPPREN
jgi:hypothetical protein